MLHPSYAELMKTVNGEVEEGEQPVVNSRYSIVLATSKRARQIIDGAHPLVEKKDDKPLSIAVEELGCGQVKILGNGEEEETEAVLPEESETTESEEASKTETGAEASETELDGEMSETIDKTEVLEENGAAEDDSQPTEEA